MTTCYDAIVGDDGRVLSLTLKTKAGVVVDVTGAVVTLHWRDATSVAVSRAMTIDNALGGVVSYQFTAAELFSPGLHYQVKVVDSIGKTTHSECIGFLSVGKPIA